MDSQAKLIYWKLLAQELTNSKIHTILKQNIAIVIFNTFRPVFTFQLTTVNNDQQIDRIMVKIM